MKKIVLILLGPFQMEHKLAQDAVCRLIWTKPQLFVHIIVRNWQYQKLFVWYWSDYRTCKQIIHILYWTFATNCIGTCPPTEIGKLKVTMQLFCSDQRSLTWTFLICSAGNLFGFYFGKSRFWITLFDGSKYEALCCAKKKKKIKFSKND